ncbi:MAG: HlyD family efflux transporter periplasmic adaptor subunit [Candidatus Marinimicrobia bacterium]|nr:HlyD family efflux transporter periplasmic adaptor subunit [Candidatus Neomarinimicrobiota bacterium]
MTTKQKQITSLAVILAVSLGITMLLVSLKSAPKRKPPMDTRPVISLLEVENSPIQVTVPVIGRLIAHEKVEILAEVSGVLKSSKKEFLTGQSYLKGEVMLRINREETELGLKAQRSGLLTAIAKLLPELKFDYPKSYLRWNTYLQSFNIESITQPLPESLNEREKFFVANKGIYNSFYQIKAQEARLEKFTMRAPFNGVLIQSNITPGNLVRIGQPVGVLVNPASYDLETSISINEVNSITVGDLVTLTSENIAGAWQGHVSRISQGMDEKNQMIKVFISVSAPELRDGLFLKGEIISSQSIAGMELPRKMLHNGNVVLEYLDGKIHYRSVNVVSTSGERAVVNGLENGMQLSTKTLNLLDGAQVKVPDMDQELPDIPKKKKGQG